MRLALQAFLPKPREDPNAPAGAPARSAPAAPGPALSQEAAQTRAGAARLSYADRVLRRPSGCEATASALTVPGRRPEAASCLTRRVPAGFMLVPEEPVGASAVQPGPTMRLAPQSS